MLTEADYIYAQKLKKLRKRSGKIQYACYRELGLKNQQDLSILENGGKHFTQEIKLKICEFFGISFSEFNALNNLSTFAQDIQIKQKDVAHTPQREHYLPVLLIKRRLVEGHLENIKLKQALVRGKREVTTTYNQVKPLYVLI